MKLNVTEAELIEHGLKADEVHSFLNKLASFSSLSAEETWQKLSQEVLSSHYPFTLHLFLFTLLFPHWHENPETAPAWIPDQNVIKSANLSLAMTDFQCKEVKTLHRFSVDNADTFWRYVINKLHLRFHKPFTKICDLSKGVTSPRWFPDARLNIIESCFTAKGDKTAILYDHDDTLIKLTYDELNRLSNRIANSLISMGFKSGDAIGIAMPMHHFAVAIYLGIIKMGGVVVSIADSFSGEEILLRLKIAKAKALMTQDFVDWMGKNLPLYEKIIQSDNVFQNELKIIVLPHGSHVTLPLRKYDIAWENFLVSNEELNIVYVDPMTPCNILFSSGTTAEPKAIVWNHTTPIKAASDAYFHQDIKSGDVLAWPTNLGWMMGPWLIFAALVNHATIAIYSGAPKERAFGEFLKRAKVTMLGVVPTLVASWRQTECMENLHLDTIKCFSSTGECSNAEDMLYLMSLAGYKPVIEYCGGTEIGGAYVSSTVIQKNYPSLFGTPTMGTDFVILDEEGNPAKEGEVAIIPPALGLSTTLLNADHEKIYFADVPSLPDGKVLRRHGDQIKVFPHGYYAVLGRADDTMKLSGIKTSSAEIERALAQFPDVLEVAAVAISPPDNGPKQLVIYAATSVKNLEKETVLKEMQKRINHHLNPLFKIHDVVFADELPKTASNKIMRRVLREAYQAGCHPRKSGDPS